MLVAGYVLVFLFLFHASTVDAATGLSAPDSLPRRALLGVTVEPAPDNHVRIKRIVPGSAAARSELAVGDLVLALNGSTIDSGSTFLATMKSFKSGDHITCRVQRGGKELNIDVSVGQRVASRAAGRYSSALGQRNLAGASEDGSRLRAASIAEGKRGA